MAQENSAKVRSGLLNCLLRNEVGGTLSIFAAAVIPLLGLVGGGVDISRIYLVRTRLQAACDAGSLMGRKVMGSGTWAANSYRARDEALKMFDFNFTVGAYGTTNLVRSFDEEPSVPGNISGDASADVPMTLMRVFKQPARTVSVTCNSEMAIPSSDVMFVLDVTGSMADPDSNGVAKINGLKKATKCFYESLVKENITSTTAADCGQNADPSGGNAGDVLIRFGFVPYSVNANVGKLLPLNYLSDTASYQSRQAQWTTDNTFRAVYGAESAATPTGAPTLGTAGNWTNWGNSPGNVTVGSVTYFRRFNSNSGQCSATTAPSAQTATTAGTMNFVSQNPTTPTYPTTTQVTRLYSQTTGSTTTEYRYTWSSSSGGRCTLQQRSKDNASSTQNYNKTVPVTWVANRTFNGWIYRQVPINVSGLKDTATNSWNDTIDVETGSNGATVQATWDGCVEERQTARVTSTSPANSDWWPIPTTAMDMNFIDAPVTTDDTTRWKPMLTNVVYGRRLNGSVTTLDVTTAQINAGTGSVTSVINPTCPVESKLYQTWTPGSFETYVNSLQPTSYTYHDVGLSWGARLMAPNGMFSSINAPAGRDIQRHMVFMTDGDTNANTGSYNSYGMDLWDRRQNNGTTIPTDAWLEANINARTQAICNWVKGQGITLWVVSFGTDVSTSAQSALQSCASPGRFFTAANSNDLNANFRSIAAEIANLRLTS